MGKIIKTNITKIGDPVILLDNDIYYMYTTYEGGRPFHVYTSLDGKHFIDQGVCLSAENQTLTSSLWAPEVIKYNGAYYMFYSGRSKRDGAMHIQVAKSLSPLGPFVNLKKEPLVNINGKSTIDAHPYIENGAAYLFFSMDCSTNVIDGIHTSQIYAVKMSSDFMRLESDFIFISTPDHPFEFKSGDLWRWNEGPFVLKHNGKYFLTYSTNHYETKYYAVGCLVSDHILGPYQKMVNHPILEHIEGKISGPGHNAFFNDKDGQLKCVFHIHTDINNPSGDRTACICDAYFTNDNKLVIDYK